MRFGWLWVWDFGQNPHPIYPSALAEIETEFSKVKKGPSNIRILGFVVTCNYMYLLRSKHTLEINDSPSEDKKRNSF